jgi:hypothetical protein
MKKRTPQYMTSFRHPDSSWEITFLGIIMPFVKIKMLYLPQVNAHNLLQIHSFLNH